jgi:hypothetical protein
MSQALCPYAERCDLARSIGMEAALHVWQSFYCEGTFGRCERYRLHGAGLEVPGRLMPNGRLIDGPDPTSLGPARSAPRRRQA